MRTLADLAEPAVVERKMLEADLQKRCVDWARERGYLCRKFSSISQRSVPDYLMFSKIAHFWVEFKAPGKQSTAAQKDEQQLLSAAGLPGFQCDDFEMFKAKVWAIEQDANDRRNI